MKDRAAFYGLAATNIEPVVERGDVAVISGREHPRAVVKTRKQLEDRITRHGFEQTMETLAYTWFNRFVAIRYMELHGYFDHGYRVLSHPEGHGHPEILDHAAEVHLPGLDRAQAVELKLDGTQDEVLYRLLLTAQCNALHHAMPFLFDRIGNETELLLPANLLHTDSLIRRLVKGIDESAWAEIEIIGWLYQCYISEKKAQVIGKVVPSEDIPAATQLFTPNWIVKYLIHNSLGSQWLAIYPDSPLKGQMAYYIEPAEQTDEVKAQLPVITPSTLNPEELTLIDPASGSGHILVEAYDLFKALYLERGHRQRDVAQLILEKNLFGLDIDGRAAQLTGFALMMKGRADDHRLFGRGRDAQRDGAGGQRRSRCRAAGPAREAGRPWIEAERPHGTEAGLRTRHHVWIADSSARGFGDEAASAEAAERGAQPRPVCIGGARAREIVGAAGRATGQALRRRGGESTVYGK